MTLAAAWTAPIGGFRAYRLRFARLNADRLAEWVQDHPEWWDLAVYALTVVERVEAEPEPETKVEAPRLPYAESERAPVVRQGLLVDPATGEILGEGR